MEKGHGKGLFTILGPGTKFEGSISVPHNLNIDGEFIGKIETSELITVGTNGVVKADIRAKSAVVAGTIEGNLVVDDRVELYQTASLTGDMRVKELVISEGAVFHGNCSMGTGKTEKV